MKQSEFYDANIGGNEGARIDSDTIFVRQFNNFIKSLLINQFSYKSGENLSVLDLCCGKGGDLRKWAKNKVTHYFGVDLSPNLVQEAQRRYMEISNQRRRHQPLFKAIFMVNDAGPRQEEYLLDNILKIERKLGDIRHKIMFDIVST